MPMYVTRGGVVEGVKKTTRKILKDLMIPPALSNCLFLNPVLGTFYLGTIGVRDG